LHLYEAACKVGYNLQEDGLLGHWLCDYLYYYLLKIDNKPNYVSLKKENVCGDIDYWVNYTDLVYIHERVVDSRKHKVIYRNNKFIYIYNLTSYAYDYLDYAALDRYLTGIDKNYILN
jgi:hypothetical protein